LQDIRPTRHPSNFTLFANSRVINRVNPLFLLRKVSTVWRKLGEGECRIYGRRTGLWPEVLENRAAQRFPQEIEQPRQTAGFYRVPPARPVFITFDQKQNSGNYDSEEYAQKRHRVGATGRLGFFGLVTRSGGGSRKKWCADHCQVCRKRCPFDAY
jgi:hypothetical protein